MNRGFNVSEPFFSQAFGAVPAVAGREAHAKEVAQFAVKVGHFSLGPSQGADAQIAHAAEVFGKDAQRRTFTNSRVPHGEGEATFADLLFNAPAEALDVGRVPQSRGGQLGGEGIKLQAIEVKQSFVHDGFEGSGAWGR